MNPSLDEMLDDCLERLAAGEDLHSCLNRYRGHRQTLEPLLRTALLLRNAPEVAPSAEFRARAPKRILNLIQGRAGYFADRSVVTSPSPPRSQSRGQTPQGRRRWASMPAIAVIVIVAVGLTGGGTIYAAQDDLPGDPLYGVKLATEQMRLALGSDTGGRAWLRLEFASSRLAEVEELLARGRRGDAAQALARYAAAVEAVGDLGDADLMEIFAEVAAQHGDHLRALEASLPDEAGEAWRRALEASSRGRERALEGLERLGGVSDRTDRGVLGEVREAELRPELPVDLAEESEPALEQARRAARRALRELPFACGRLRWALSVFRAREMREELRIAARTVVEAAAGCRAAGQRALEALANLDGVNEARGDLLEDLPEDLPELLREAAEALLVAQAALAEVCQDGSGTLGDRLGRILSSFLSDDLREAVRGAIDAAGIGCESAAEALGRALETVARLRFAISQGE